MNDEDEPISIADAAYSIIADSEKDWTKDELVAALARAGFSPEDDAELDSIVAEVQERIKNENILSEAILTFLGESGFQDLRQASDKFDCSVEEVVEMIVANTHLFGKPH